MIPILFYPPLVVCHCFCPRLSFEFFWYIWPDMWRMLTNFLQNPTQHCWHWSRSELLLQDCQGESQQLTDINVFSPLQVSQIFCSFLAKKKTFLTYNLNLIKSLRSLFSEAICKVMNIQLRHYYEWLSLGWGMGDSHKLLNYEFDNPSLTMINCCSSFNSVYISMILVLKLKCSLSACCLSTAWMVMFYISY